MCIILVYSDVLYDASALSVATTIISVSILYILVKVFIHLLRLLEPQAHDEVEDLIQDVEHDLEEAAKESHTINTKKKKS
ncbi:MAG: hypothetical protein KKF44_05640 [Nanoarchaeota archaeon]|nr:hypothetical protein [Nanoarchaeota archaeon]